MQSIEDTRRLFPGHERLVNTTTVQTASGYYAGVCWALANPRMGVCFPEVIPEEYLFERVEHLLAPMYDGPVEFDLKKKPPRRAGEKPGEARDPYSFEGFRI